MSSYVTYSDFINSPYGREYAVTDSHDGCLFSASGQVQDFLDQISDLIDLYTGRTFGTGYVTEEFVAVSGKDKIFLKRFPVHSVSGVIYFPPTYWSSGFNLDTQIMPSSEYRYFTNGRVIFTRDLYYGSVYQITYLAGYNEIPGPIKQAVMMLANSYAGAIDVGAVGIPEGGNTTRVAFNGFETNYVDPRQRYDLPNNGIPITIQAILNRYKTLK
jgi:hypothetical protein